MKDNVYRTKSKSGKLWAVDQRVVNFLTTQLVFETPTSKKSSLLVLAGRPSSLLTVGLQGRIWMLPGTAHGMHRLMGNRSRFQTAGSLWVVPISPLFPLPIPLRQVHMHALGELHTLVLHYNRSQPTTAVHPACWVASLKTAPSPVQKLSKPTYPIEEKKSAQCTV